MKKIRFYFSAFNGYGNRGSNTLSRLEKEINKHFAEVGTLRLNKHIYKVLILSISNMAEWEAPVSLSSNRDTNSAIHGPVPL